MRIPKSLLGIILLLVSGVLLVIAIDQLTPTMTVDFPCLAGYGMRPNVGPNTKIAYCISHWPREAISGGGVYALGATDQTEITVEKLKFIRQGQTLVVNEHRLEIGETYNKVHWALSLNPWFIFTTRFVVMNEGLRQTDSLTLNDMLYISGDVHESWFPKPMGLLIFGSGIWFLVQGIKEGELL
jgi:hypothetical protein